MFITTKFFPSKDNYAEFVEQTIEESLENLKTRFGLFGKFKISYFLQLFGLGAHSLSKEPGARRWWSRKCGGQKGVLAGTGNAPRLEFMVILEEENGIRQKVWELGMFGLTPNITLFISFSTKESRLPLLDKIWRKVAWIYGHTQNAWKAHLESKVRSIGVSNYEIDHLEEIVNFGKKVPAVNQVEYHPHFRRPQLKDYCAKHGIFFQVLIS